MGEQAFGVKVQTLPVGVLATNCYLVHDPLSGEMLVIDPGAEPERLLSAIRESGARVVAIVNTHGHWDHIGANAAVKEATGAPLLIHAADAGWLTDSAANRSALRPLPPVASPSADRLLQEGEELPLGRHRLRVIHTPGHTAGGICLYLPGLLFSGDTLFAESVGRTDLPGGSWTALRSSIREKLFALPVETVVYPGHGPSTTIGDERSLNPYV
ncbi:MAG TPA: MBL fold metallo-hydrolase [Firmicutes bacterium]|nr:MBL fold metallo-hydrolase [Bacillota bacterium]